ncbi:IPO9 [Cordylochernes scorpioides]|uniref:IPO9 n=1 Tax=Cordylochernes scorpioides TaxID=51811 RepID=A0ABY6LMR8_9ARAC|nr:IPO9 [Cordylochernes scorpioides]
MSQAKAIIRSLLPSGLREPISKVRSSVAYAISAIAQWDWPEQWPELFDFLVLCISGEEEGAVHGAMRVLAEFSREVSDRQMPQVAAVILPQMYRIYVEPELYMCPPQQKYSVRTRSLALEIFATCVQMILITGIYDKVSGHLLCSDTP